MKIHITAIALALASMSAFAQQDPSQAGGAYGAQIRSESSQAIVITGTRSFDRTLYSETAGEPGFVITSLLSLAEVRAELMDYFAHFGRTHYSETAGEPGFWTMANVVSAQARTELMLARAPQ